MSHPLGDQECSHPTAWGGRGCIRPRELAVAAALPSRTRALLLLTPAAPLDATRALGQLIRIEASKPSQLFLMGLSITLIQAVQRDVTDLAMCNG